MKKYLILTLFLFGLLQSNAQNCPFMFVVNGSTVNFTHSWPIIGTQSVDSIRFDYGDGMTALFTAPVPFMSNYTFSTGGTYNVCITRYISDLTQPGVVLTCMSCQMITVAGGGGGVACMTTADFSHSSMLQNVTFMNISTCTGCASLVYSWDFGDGNVSSLENPMHNFANGGMFDVRLLAFGTDSAGMNCTDTLIKTINVTGVGIENIKKNQLKLFQIGNNGLIGIEVPNNEKAQNIVVSDVSGRIIYNKEVMESGENKISINLQEQVSGIYFIRLQTDKNIYSATFVKTE